MFDAAIAGAGALMTLYVALRREVRRSYELLQKDISHLRDDNGRLERRMEQGQTEVRSDIRRLDEKIDAVRGELIGFLGR